MKSGKIYSVLCLQGDGSWREVFTSAKLKNAQDYVNSYKNQYRMTIKAVESKRKHHGFSYEDAE